MVSALRSDRYAIRSTQRLYAPTREALDAVGFLSGNRMRDNMPSPPTLSQRIHAQSVSPLASGASPLLTLTSNQCDEFLQMGPIEKLCNRNIHNPAYTNFRPQVNAARHF